MFCSFAVSQQDGEELAEEFSLLAADLEESGLETGSLVEIISSSPPLYGVVRWTGKLDSRSQALVGVELVSLLSLLPSTFEGKCAIRS